MWLKMPRFVVSRMDALADLLTDREFVVSAMEKTLELGPILGFMVALPFLVRRYTRQQKCTPDGMDFLLLGKLFFCSLLFACTPNFVPASFESELLSPQKGFAQIATSLEAFSLMIFFYYEHQYQTHHTTWFTMYLLFTIVTAICVGLRHMSSAIYEDQLPILGGVILVRFMILWFHEKPKWSCLKPDVQRRVGEDATYGFWDQHCASWVNPIISEAFFSSNFTGNLKPPPPDLTTENLSAKFELFWEHHQNSKNRLLQTYLSMHKPILLRGALAALVGIVCCITWPLLVEALARHLRMTSDDPTASRDFSGLDISLCASVLCLALFLSHASEGYYQSYMATSTRGIMTTAIFRKVSALPDNLSREHAKLSLLNADVETVAQTFELIRGTFKALLYITLSFALLWEDLGPILWSIMITVFFSALVGQNWAAEGGKANKDLYDKKESRSALLNESLRNLKSLRMTHRGPIIAKILKDRVKDEIAAFHLSFWHRCKIHRIEVSCDAILRYFALSNHYSAFFGDTDAATTLKMFGLVHLYLWYLMDLTQFPQQLRSTLGSFERIEAFLALPIPLDDPPRDNPQAPSLDQNSAVEFREASMPAMPSGEIFLNKVDMSIQRDTMAIIIGPRHCGKSTLLRSIVDKRHVAEGQVNVARGSVAYCGQHVWLQHQSIRANIIGFAPFNQSWYEQVKRACLLSDDISNLPGMDDYVIALNGTDLSYAQRQRLALARAVYMQAKLVILDDCLSAQDNVIASHLNERLFATGGLLTRSSTVLLAMRNPTPYLRSGQQFFVFDNFGDIASVTQRRATSYISANPALNNQDGDVDEHLSSQSQNASHLNTYPTNIMQQVLRTTPVQLTFAKAPYNFYFQKIDFDILFICGVLVALATLLELSVEICVAIYFKNEPPKIIPISWYMLVAALTGVTISAAQLLVTRITCTRSTLALFDSVLDGISRISLDPNKLSSVISAASVSQDVAFHGINRAVLGVVYYTSMLSIRYTLVCIMNPYFTLALLAFAIVFWVILRAYSTIGPQLHNMQMHSDQQICSRFAEIVTGTSHLHALDWREQSHRVSQIHIDQRLAISHYQDAVTRWRMVAVDMIFCVATALSVIGSIHFGLAPYYSALLAHLVFPRMQFPSCIVSAALRMDVALSTAGQMRVFTDAPEAIEYGDNAFSAEWPEKGHIEISDVAVRYEERDIMAVLHGVSLSVEPSARVGLYGSSGSGKSTLPLAILNLVSYRGSIKIDGREVRDIPPDVLKTRITVVTERPILIPGTVRQNLLPEEFIVDPEDPEPAMIAFEHILGRLELWDALIEQGGMSTDISKIVFSEDQWQRFSLAQALTTHLYQQNKIVIVNNVTSHVNEASRAVMQEVMEEIFGKCTQIITGHMPSSVRGAHRLYLVRNRRVIPHEEVIAAANNAASSSGGSAPNQQPPAPGQASGSTPRQNKQTHQQPQAEASGSQPRQSAEASGSRTRHTHPPAEASGSGSRTAQSTTSSSTEHPTTLPSSSSGTASRARRPAPQPQGSTRGKQPLYDQQPPTSTYRQPATQTHQPVPPAFHNPPLPRTAAETHQPPSKHFEALRAAGVVPPAPAGYPTAQPRAPQSRAPSKEELDIIKEFLAFVQKSGRRDMSLDEYLDLRPHDPIAQQARRWGPHYR